ncbi:hypothetical protein JTB14_009425 [Gonioctena quinquepunctata]|nr:hypothetical protein JTB14_009425 [Gonioctena quinquepunctata]
MTHSDSTGISHKWANNIKDSKNLRTPIVLFIKTANPIIQDFREWFHPHVTMKFHSFIQASKFQGGTINLEIKLSVDRKNELPRLNPFLDEDILRVGGRPQHDILSARQKHHKMIPSSPNRSSTNFKANSSKHNPHTRKRIIYRQRPNQ